LILAQESIFVNNFMQNCALPLHEKPISLRPSGLTSWIFMVNYTHKRPLCGHCAPPLHEKANQSAPFGLDLLDFHGTIKIDDCGKFQQREA